MSCSFHDTWAVEMVLIPVYKGNGHVADTEEQVIASWKSLE